MNLLEDFPTLPSCIVDLNLSKNMLQNIPEIEIEHLQSLKILDLSGNKISSVPKTFASIKFKSKKLINA